MRDSSQNIRTCGMVVRICVDPYPLNFAMSGNCGIFANGLGGRMWRRRVFTNQVSGKSVLDTWGPWHCHRGLEVDLVLEDRVRGHEDPRRRSPRRSFVWVRIEDYVLLRILVKDSLGGFFLVKYLQNIGGCPWGHGTWGNDEGLILSPRSPVARGQTLV